LKKSNQKDLLYGDFEEILVYLKKIVFEDFVGNPG